MPLPAGPICVVLLPPPIARATDRTSKFSSGLLFDDSDGDLALTES